VDEAIEQYQLALSLDPENLNTRCNLGAALADGQGPRAAIAAYRDILAVKPDHLVAHSNLLFNMTYDGETSSDVYLAEARRFDAKLARQSLPPKAPEAPVGRDRPLRIGFVSGDLRGHPVGYFVEGLVQHLDRSRFELYAYATLPTNDELTARLQARFAGWRLIKGEAAEAAARAIREQGIDVLIDLSGHTGNNRLDVFPWRPAPLQLSWLGYFASTGVSGIDYVIADPVCVPSGNERQFSEGIWRLPHTRLCFTPPTDAPPVAALPALASGFPTFGCFQRLPKINEDVLALWGRIFRSMPKARLLLQSPQFARQRFVDETLDRLAQVGMAPERVTVLKPAHRATYLATYAQVDVVLDTFPYTGGTTTCEALWMGVPTLTLAGDTMLSRQGAAMLCAAGLPDWVAADPDDYVQKAQRLTADSARLAELRAGLREQVRRSPLFDTERFARDFEEALLELWQQSLQHSSISGHFPSPSQ
jgi:predicted O-linked N-acetylglucosamine transferase (SPINDLY family)